MLGILLQAVATFLEEISGSLGKWMVSRREESYFAIGFQNTALVLVFFLTLVAFEPSRWKLDPRSLPSMAVYLVLAVVQGAAALKSSAVAERSTWNFIRTGTIPLLLLVDVVAGNAVGGGQAIGILVITVALGALFLYQGIDRKGIGLTAFSALNAVATISIYKWHITAYNSVATEQIFSHGALAIFFFWGSRRYFRENPLKLFARPHAMLQSVTYSAGSIIESYAFLYAPASVITTAKRSFAVLWSIIAGHKVFKEKALGHRLAVFAIVVVGLILLTK